MLCMDCESEINSYWLPIYYYYYCDEPSHIQQCTHMAYKSTEARNRQDSSVAVRHNTFANTSISHDQHRYTNSYVMCLRQMRGFSKGSHTLGWIHEEAPQWDTLWSRLASRPSMSRLEKYMSFPYTPQLHITWLHTTLTEMSQEMTHVVIEDKMSGYCSMADNVHMQVYTGQLRHQCHKTG